MKYRPHYPEKPFSGLTAARNWVQSFVGWYNKEHLHSSIKFVTPDQRHTGSDHEILQHRKAVYTQAKLNTPNRWSGEIRNCDKIKDEHLNPDNQKAEKKRGGIILQL